MKRIKELIDRAAVQFDQSATHNGLQNCDAITMARTSVKDVEHVLTEVDDLLKCYSGAYLPVKEAQRLGKLLRELAGVQP